MKSHKPSLDFARQLLLHNKQATGGDAWDEVVALHLRSTIRQGGLSGILEQWQDALTGRYAQQYSLGITSGGEGFDGLLPWSQDTAGYRRIEENGDSREGAANTAYRACLAWWYPERWGAKLEYIGQARNGDNPCHVVRIVPEGGRPFDLWIDVVTSLFVRRVEQAAFETITYSFSDYRLADAVRLPFHTCIGNGHPQYDRVCVLQQVDFNHADIEAQLRVPPPPVPDFQISDDQQSMDIPFRCAGNLILVDVSINGGRVLPFILDTGGVNLVTPETADELELESHGIFWGFGGGEEVVDMAATTISSLEFGGIRMENQVIWIYPFPELKEALGIAELGGLLGYEVFRRFVVRVDYQSEKLTLTLPEHYDYRGCGQAVPFKFNSNIPEVVGDVDGIAGKFDLDTGNTGALILNAPFVETHGLATRYGATELKIGEGAGGGTVSFLVAQARRVQLGAVEVTDLPIALSLHRSGALSNPYAAGLVGAALFQRFTMIFDYSRQQVIFEERTPE